MNFEIFCESLSLSSPPSQVSEHLRSLWYAAKGDWHRSHEIIQDIDDVDAAWIHAYLHRKEGDIWNADYWYRRAGRQRPLLSLEEEWKEIVLTLIQ